MTRALVCPDKFKGTFTSIEVCAALASGLRDAGWDAVELPAGDGGEGTAAALIASVGGDWVEARASDALGRPVEARFALLTDGTAAVDAAEAIGLWRLDPEERDPLAATSRGAGELVAAALAVARAVIVGSGGTATVDGGAGALGVLPPSARGRLRVACDVRTPWEDAASVFGPQKGADAAAVALLSERLAALAALLPRDPTGVPGGGCGGGLSGGLWAAFDAELVPGAELVLQALDFDEKLRGASLVVTGEGRLDAQTAEGKLVGVVAEWARSARVPCVAIVGSDALGAEAAVELGISRVIEAEDERALAAAARSLASA